MTCVGKHKYLKRFKQATQDLWRSYSVNELTCQNYKILIVGSDVSIYTVIKAMIKYNKSFVIVFEKDLKQFVGYFGYQQIVPYLTHIYLFFSKMLYRDRLMSSVSLFSKTSHPVIISKNWLLENNNTDTEDNCSNSQNPTIEAALCEITNFLYPLPDWFSVSLLSDIFKNPSLFSRFYTFLEQSREKHNILKSDEIRCDKHHHSHSVHLWPSPFIYTLNTWRYIAGVDAAAPFLTISPEEPLQNAVSLLLETVESHIAVWDKNRSCPFQMLSCSYFLYHLVQHLRGSHPALDLYVREELNIGIKGADVVVVHPITPFQQVLRIFWEKQWKTLPVVDDSDLSFLGFISSNHMISICGQIFDAHIKKGYTSDAQYEQVQIPDDSSDESSAFFVKSKKIFNSFLPENSSNKTVIPTVLNLNEPLNHIMQTYFNYSFYHSLYPFYSYEKKNICDSFTESITETLENKPNITFSFLSDRVLSDTFDEKNVTQSEEKNNDNCHNSIMNSINKEIISETSSLKPQSNNKMSDINSLSGLPTPVTSTSHVETPRETHDLNAFLYKKSSKVVLPSAVSDSDITLRNAISHVLMSQEERVLLVHPETRIQHLISPRNILLLLDPKE
ncbi:uncharacterized protein LOC128884213 isoform X2 [Hylaeus volcanicus]|uniref:uncharacterized protein LOC128884213 isoform X2 n=1 Tax=Hylaeus volcanicus TaxID=313075 RepID=UPI0023B86256|nr:uncharacterized protein LOC128884213 isoform X2 [Hylaeus volcanicus]